MPEYSEDFLKKTIEAWQPYSEAPLTLEDAREIMDNMVSLYSFLFELEQKYGKEKEKKA